MLSRLIVAALTLWIVQVSAASYGGPKLTRNMYDDRYAKSQQIRMYMDETMNPCDSFLDFACGSWSIHYPTDENVTRTRAFVNALNDFSSRLPNLLTAVDARDTEAELKVKNYYQSCMAATSLYPANYPEKLKEIAKEFGQMPVLAGDEWQEENFDWLKTVAQISHKYGTRIVLGYMLSQDMSDQSAYNALLLAHEFKLTNTGGVASALVHFLDVDEEMALEVAQEMVDFDEVLKAAYDSDIYDDCTSLSVEEMSIRYSPGFDVMKFFNISYGSIPSGQFIFRCPYVEMLSDIMKNTPKKVVANYVFVYLLLDFMEYFSKSEDVMQEACVEKTQSTFKKVVSYMFYRSFDLKEAEQKVEHLWEDIKTTLQMILESSRLGWFDDDTREYVLEKLHSVKMVVPSYTDTNLDGEYAHLIMNNEDYVENVRALKAFTAAQDRALLNEMPPNTDSGLDLNTPTYSPYSNTITIPVSVLKNEFFYSSSYPNVLHSAHLGYLLGHEVLHGFSGDGRKFNKLGNYVGDRNQEIEAGYEERRKCFYDQYHNYLFGGKQLPQDETQSENSADNGGVLLAYETYRRWYDDEMRTEEELALENMPNMNYTSNQLFFIYYAQTWCADTHYDARAQVATGDEHSPDEFRAFVPLINYDEFSEAFNCPKGTAMNPVKKCTLY